MAGLRTLSVATVGALALSVLAMGCAPGEPDVVDKTPPPSASATSAPVPHEEDAAVFVAPSDCTAMIGPTLSAEFAADNIVLFDSTVGGGIYSGASDQVTVQTGGSPFFCLFGQDMVDLSSFQLEAQLLSQSAHEGVVASLEGSGLTKTVDGDIVTYVAVGDEMGAPALVHVLRPEGWLTASSAFGGEAQVAMLTSYLDAVATQVYPG